MLLEEKVSIITGAARGTGATTARRFVDEGATVIVADVLEAEGKETANELGPRAEFHHLDVTDEASWAALVNDVMAKHGRIDVLVNNAAILHMGTIENTPLDVYRRVLDVNTTGAFAGIRAIIGPMKAAGSGSIVNISSVDGMHGMNATTAYSSSKFGMRGLSKSAALELGRYGIRVNTVCPGGGNPAMYAPWGAKLADLAAETAVYLQNRAIPRAASQEEIADGIVFLASDLARFITGVDLPVDGGLVAGAFIGGFQSL